jgi:cytochrome c
MKKIVVVIAFAAVFIAACSSGNNEGNSSSNNTENTATEQQSTESLNAEANASANMVQVPAEINELLNKNTCLSCHEANEKVVGPAYKEISKRNYSAKEIVELIYKPKPSNWPDYPPMIGLPNVPKDEALKIAEWIVSLNK